MFGVDKKKKLVPFSSKKAERARPEDDSRNRVGVLGDVEGRLREMAEGEQGQDRRVEGDADKDGRKH